MSMSYNAEDHTEVLLIGHLNPAILISIITSEYISQPLKMWRKKKHLCVQGKIRLPHFHVWMLLLCAFCRHGMVSGTQRELFAVFHAWAVQWIWFCDLRTHLSLSKLLFISQNNFYSWLFRSWEQSKILATFESQLQTGAEEYYY